MESKYLNINDTFSIRSHLYVAYLLRCQLKIGCARFRIEKETPSGTHVLAPMWPCGGEGRREQARRHCRCTCGEHAVG